MELAEFLKKHAELTESLYTQICLAYRNASIIWTPEAYAELERLDFEYNKILNDPVMFAYAKQFHEQNLWDETLQREVKFIYLWYLSHQWDLGLLKEISAISTEIEQDFATFRAHVDGKVFTDNDIIEVLENSTDSGYLQKVWEANKAVGFDIEAKLLQLVRLRNKLAQSLWFSDYHTLSLTFGEQDPSTIQTIFDELDILTKPTFERLKKDLDTNLAARYGITEQDLMPWHFQDRFFQEAPKIWSKYDVDKIYEGKNLADITSSFYKSIWLPIDDMLAKSDLYEKPGKNQHAYCIHLDRAGDVRVLCNIKENAKWMDTMLHEFGHASYDKCIDFSLPKTLVEPAHTFVTEAVAMFFGRLGNNAQWIQDIFHIDDTTKAEIQESSHKASQLRQLIFSRWAQVMFRFEKSLYQNPEQDLQDLRWSLVERYQLLHRPANREQAADWATKIHIATAPCYYHNYLLWELLASQFGDTLSKEFFGGQSFETCSLVNHPEIWDFFKNRLFKKGASVTRDQAIIESTGRSLSSESYAKEFCSD